MNVKEALEKFPTMPSMTIAKMLFNENPDGRSVEAIRSEIRYHRGTNGKDNSKEMGIISPPVSLKKEWPVFVIPESLDNTLVLADIHIPNHDVESIEIAIREAKRRKVNSVILNGDIFDFYQISRFNKKLSNVGVVKEIEIGNEFLDYLTESLPKAKIIFKEGNHDERLDNYVQRECEKIYGMKGLSLVSQIDALGRGFLYVGDQKIMKYGHLNIIHGHEVNGLGGVNPGRSLYLKTKTNTLANHVHRCGTHHEPDMNKTFVTCWTGGCNCELHPEFARVNAWNLGHTFITRSKGEFKLENYKIINGKIYPA